MISGDAATGIRSEHTPQGEADIRLRAFASRPSDLDLDLDQGSRAEAITAVLCACSNSAEHGELSADTIWDWSLAQRLQYLLQLVMLSLGHRQCIEVRCEHNACRQMMELPLDLSAFRQSPSNGPISLKVEPGIQLELRLPNGRDQLRWQQTATGLDERWAMVAADALIQTVNGAPVSPDSELSADWLPSIEAALEAQDPLTTLQLKIRCPFCDTPASLDFDLEAWLLQRLDAWQTQSLDAVHRLAVAYHWSEAEILALPEPRRAAYLGRLETLQ